MDTKQLHALVTELIDASYETGYNSAKGRDYSDLQNRAIQRRQDARDKLMAALDTTKVVAAARAEAFEECATILRQYVMEGSVLITAIRDAVGRTAPDRRAEAFEEAARIVEAHNDHDEFDVITAQIAAAIRAAASKGE